MRVGVFRAEDDGRRTATRLAELGHEAVLAPVLSIVATGLSVQVDTADVLVFTSARAPEALSRHPDGLGRLRHLPCWCVGARTAAAARSAGFKHVRAGAGDAAGLVHAIAAEDRTKRLTLVAARDRKSDLETGLAHAGLALDVVEAYAAQAVSGWPSALVERLSDIEGALHYSRRSAALALRLAETLGLGTRFRALPHYCLSADVRQALRDCGIDGAKVASRPDEDSMLALLPDP